MARTPSLVLRALNLVFFIPFISCLPTNDTSLVSRQVEQGFHFENFQITFYGAPDSYSAAINCESGVANNQGSNTIAHPYCPWNGGYRGQYAGGDGSYGNPLTAASRFESSTSPIPQCGVWYSSFLQKWLIYEDECPSCYGATGKAHFDIWVGGNGGGTNSHNNPAICQCEDALTPGNSMACAAWDVLFPSKLPVNTAVLWNGNSCINIGGLQWQKTGNNNNLDCSSLS